MQPLCSTTRSILISQRTYNTKEAPPTSTVQTTQSFSPYLFYILSVTMFYTDLLCSDRKFLGHVEALGLYMFW